jgi:RNA-directed DNA polymerase
LQHYAHRVNFLGVVIKPRRIYIGRRMKDNFYQAIQVQNSLIKNHPPGAAEQATFLSGMNSYLGMMKHYKAYRLRQRMLLRYVYRAWWAFFYCGEGCSKLKLRKKLISAKIRFILALY